jgi:transcriptional regulator with XRE-family HTH domain
MACNKLLKLKSEVILQFETIARYAEELKVSEQVVSRVINARQTLDISEEFRWAHALGKEPSELFLPDQQYHELRGGDAIAKKR